MNCILLIVIVAVWIPSSFESCGYEACNPGKEGMLNVHLVPHTHDDVGWLATVDQYYYQEVVYILDNVITELQKDPNRKFSYVEMAFFTRWWRQQTPAIQTAVKNMVQNGQLQFILGGWCMEDEATTHYTAMIDQMTLGLNFLSENFGECGRPRVAWQIDPFGHSREQASLYAQMGFDGVFLGRIDYQDKFFRILEKRMEMIWKASSSVGGDKAWLFTNIMTRSYQEPVELNPSNNPIQDDHRLNDYNVDDRIDVLVKDILSYNLSYATNNILIPMGNDFEYQQAHKWFYNMDRLIKYTNARQIKGSKFNIFYSTPSCYVHAINKATIKSGLTTKTDDFLPYADKPHGFWTGYYTSRPAFKRYVRETSNILQACKQLDVLTSKNAFSDILRLKEAMGVSQHHDAVSGTEKQVVTFDYTQRLYAGRQSCQNVIYSALSDISLNQSPTDHKDDLMITKSGLSGRSGVDHAFCDYLNISLCAITESSQSFKAVVYNPLAWTVGAWIRFPTGTAGNYTVTGPEGFLPVASFGLDSATSHLRLIHGATQAVNTLYTFASLPPLSLSTLQVQPQKFRSPAAPSRVPIIPIEVSKVVRFRDNGRVTSRKRPRADTIVSNGMTSLTIDGTTGLLKQIQNLQAQGLPPLNVKQNFYYYIGSVHDGPNSGAYIFRPMNGSTAQPVTSTVHTTIIHNKYASEVRQVFGSWASQTIRLYAGEPNIELEWTIGPLSYREIGNTSHGIEVISRFDTDINSGGLYYTDSNGREMQRRQRNFRPTWKLDQTEPVSGNYYPVNSKILLQDEASRPEKRAFAVLTDRSQAGGSISDGSAELMVHRFTAADDGLGVGEPLHEPGVDGKGLIVRGKHWLLYDTTSGIVARHRTAAVRYFGQPIVMFQTTPRPHVFSSSPDQSSGSITFGKGNLKELEQLKKSLAVALPPNLHLVTLEQYKSTGEKLLRLEHIFEANEDATYSKPVTISLSDLFTPFTITSVQEMSLSANQVYSEMKRLKWTTVNTAGKVGRNQESPSSQDVVNDVTITIKPMEIRTFIIQIQHHK